MAAPSPKEETRVHLDRYVSTKKEFSLKASAAGFAVGLFKGARTGSAVKALVAHDTKLADPVQAYLIAARYSQAIDPMANMVMAARSLSRLPGLLAGPYGGSNKLAHVVATLNDFLAQAEFVFGSPGDPHVNPQETGLRMQILLAARYQFCAEHRMDPASMDTADRWSQNFPGHAVSILTIAQQLLASRPAIAWPKGYTPYSDAEIGAALHLVAGYRDPVFSFLGMEPVDESKAKSGNVSSAKSDANVAQTDFHRLQTLTPGQGATALCCDALELAMKTVQNGHHHAGELLRPEVRLLTDLEALQILHADATTVTPAQRELGFVWLEQSANVLGMQPAYDALCAQRNAMNASGERLSMAWDAKSAAIAAYNTQAPHANAVEEQRLYDARHAANAASFAAEAAHSEATTFFLTAYQTVALDFANALAGAIEFSQHPEVAALGRAVHNARDVPATLATLREDARDLDSLFWSPARRNIDGKSRGGMGLGKELLSLMMWNEAVTQAVPDNTITAVDGRWQDAQQHAWLQQAALRLRGPEQTEVQKKINALYREEKPSDNDIKKRSLEANKLIAGLEKLHPELPNFTGLPIDLDMEDANTASDLARAMTHNHMFERKTEGTMPHAKLPKRGHNALGTLAKLCIAEVVMARRFAESESVA